MAGLNNKEIIDYFRSNIFESIAAYSGWKMIYLSKSTGIFPDEMAKRYLEIQKYHSNFFQITERALLVNFVMSSLHSFDNSQNNTYSLYLINNTETNNFVKDNKDVIEKLRKVRNKLFAHKDAKNKKYVLPPFNELDDFFEKLIKFYNSLSAQVDNSSTMFDNAKEVKRDIELLFMNLYRGENIRKKSIEIEWSWEKNSKKASDIL